LLPRLDAWIAKARNLVDDAPRHRATLAELDAAGVVLPEARAALESIIVRVISA